MSIENKIDFAVVFTVNNANPNGDPLNGNRPRTTLDGIGEVSDVCIKRKIRNRLQDMGREEGSNIKIFVQSDDNTVDGKKNLKERAEPFLSMAGGKKRGDEEFVNAVCKEWFDVRAFGQLFAFKGNEISIGIRGPVSVFPAFSLSAINVSSTQITKSVNSVEGDKKTSDTMGMKYRVDRGTYVFYGSVNPQLAKKTGFSEADAEALKKALKTLFMNDSSSARPDGSMDVVRMYWWKHNCASGQYSSARVHRSLKITRTREDACDFSHYDFSLEKLEGLYPEIYEN